MASLEDAFASFLALDDSIVIDPAYLGNAISDLVVSGSRIHRLEKRDFKVYGP